MPLLSAGRAFSTRLTLPATSVTTICPFLPSSRSEIFHLSRGLAVRQSPPDWCRRIGSLPGLIVSATSMTERGARRRSRLSLSRSRSRICLISESSPLASNRSSVGLLLLLRVQRLLQTAAVAPAVVRILSARSRHTVTRAIAVTASASAAGSTPASIYVRV